MASLIKGYQRLPRPPALISQCSHAHVAMQYEPCAEFSTIMGETQLSPCSKPRTNSITLAEDISHGFSIHPDPAIYRGCS